MITNESGRRLRMLLIDDEDQTIFTENFSTHVTIEQIRYWKQAQGLLAREGRVNGADVLLIDVSMTEDHDIKNAVTKDASVPILPAGPLMALPFIGARAVMSCKVYSAHMQNSDLHKHPYFLLSMGLIAARTVNVPQGGALLSKHLNPDVSSDLLDQVVREHAKVFLADPEGAFGPALDEYRERLWEMVHRNLVTFCNRAPVISEIKSLRKLLKKEKNKNISIPDTLKLAIAGDNWSDCISIRSLFADLLKSSHSATVPWLTEVENWLESLGESNLERALNIIAEQNKTEDSGHPRSLVTTIRDKLYPKLSQQDKK